jgi:hypothetical protein
MKNINYWIVLIQIFVMHYSYAQKISIDGFGGHSYFLRKNADGYNLGIGLKYTTSKKSSVGLIFSHNYNDNTSLPSNLKDAKIVLKEESNRLPLGAGFADWEKEHNWPKIRLEEQPNRFFRFDIGLQYTFTKSFKKDSYFDFTIGTLFSWRDESEMIKLVETSKLRGLFFRPTDDYSIPVFNYNTYLDLGLKCECTYFLILLNKMALGYRSGFVLYPKSNDLMINNSIVISFRQ